MLAIATSGDQLVVSTHSSVEYEEIDGRQLDGTSARHVQVSAVSPPLATWQTGNQNRRFSIRFHRYLSTVA